MHHVQFETLSDSELRTAYEHALLVQAAKSTRSVRYSRRTRDTEVAELLAMMKQRDMRSDLPEMDVVDLGNGRFEVSVVNHWDCPRDPTKDELLYVLGLDDCTYRHIGQQGLKVYAVQAVAGNRQESPRSAEGWTMANMLAPNEPGHFAEDVE
jgi:hypothetical protein